MQFSFAPDSALDLFLRNRGLVSPAYASLWGTEKWQELKADLERFFFETSQGQLIASPPESRRAIPNTQGARRCTCYNHDLRSA